MLEHSRLGRPWTGFGIQSTSRPKIGKLPSCLDTGCRDAILSGIDCSRIHRMGDGWDDRFRFCQTEEKEVLW